MRRFALSLAVGAALALGACSGGGSVLSFNNSSSPDRVIVTTGQTTTNVARVLPGAPITLSATAVRGGSNGYLSNNRFTWTAALTTGGQYPVNALGQTKTCANVNVTLAGATAPTPYTADFSGYLVIDPTNTANVVFTPPATIPLPAGATTISPNFPYCVAVTATADNGAMGTITVAVVSPAGPLN